MKLENKSFGLLNLYKKNKINISVCMFYNS